MGWNSWDCYGASVNEAQLLANAEVMRDVLKPCGWEYVVCDIQWSEPTANSVYYHPFAKLCMDEYGRLLPAPNRFPSGFRAIAERIHEMGLKFGIHVMRGIPRQAVYADCPVLGADCTARDVAFGHKECIWNTDMYGVKPDHPGSQAYYDSIFALYAEWGVDFVKVDDICRTDYSADSYASRADVEMIRRAIDRCGRPMVLSLSPGPARVDCAWHLCENANMWRLVDDLWDNWPSVKAVFERFEAWQAFVQPGCWPDADMLPLGTLRMWTGGDASKLTQDEQISLISMWCLFRAPLMMGGELTRMDEFTRKLLTRADVLRLLKTPYAARQLRRNADEAVWTSRDADGHVIAGLFNLSDTRKTVTAEGLENGASSAWRNLWTDEMVSGNGSSVSLCLDAHACALLRLL